MTCSVKLQKVQSHIQVGMINFFGESAAESEWGDNPQKAIKTFIHTDAYEAFGNQNVLFMFGRRGTGKSAILRMTKAMIDTGEYRLFKHKVANVISEHDAFYEIALNSRTSEVQNLPFEELVHFYKKQWITIVNIAALQSVYEKYKYNGTSDIDCIRKYLSGADLIENQKPIQKISSIIGKSINDSNCTPANWIRTFNNILSTITGGDYDKALAAMANILRRESGYCLVMMDSIEDFRHDDTIVSALISGSIKAASELDIEKENTRIVFKIAFPTEMHDHITKWHREKVDGKLIHVIWTYAQLVTLIAKRFCYRMDGKSAEECSDKYDTVKSAKSLLYEYMPNTITSTGGITLDTLSYVIRHTQKRPRQLIRIFNTIYNYADMVGHIDVIDEKTLDEGLHQRLDLVVSGTLDIYNRIYQGSENFFIRALTDKKAIFTYGELHQYLKEVRDRKNIFPTTSAVESFLLETGLVGIVVGSHISHSFNVKWYDVQFEYQVSKVLTMTNDSTLAIHPAMYNELCCKIDLDEFVYPSSSESEELEVLIESGVYSPDDE